MVPFEAVHPQEALFMMSIFSNGWIIRETSDGVLFPAIPVKLKKRTCKYKDKIAWIRSLPEIDL